MKTSCAPKNQTNNSNPSQSSQRSYPEQDSSLQVSGDIPKQAVDVGKAPLGKVGQRGTGRGAGARSPPAARPPSLAGGYWLLVEGLFARNPTVRIYGGTNATSRPSPRLAPVARRSPPARPTGQRPRFNAAATYSPRPLTDLGQAARHPGPPLPTVTMADGHRACPGGSPEPPPLRPAPESTPGGPFPCHLPPPHAHLPSFPPLPGRCESGTPQPFPRRRPPAPGRGLPPHHRTTHPPAPPRY